MDVYGQIDLEARCDAKFNEQLASLPADQGREEKRQMLRGLPIFALIIAKGGPKLVRTDVSGAALSGARGRINIKGSDDALAILALELSWRLGRPVIDQTGLKGRYDLTLNWTEEDGPPPGSIGTFLFRAVQEQPGLKLQAPKGPAPILVIDHAERPSEN